MSPDQQTREAFDAWMDSLEAMRDVQWNFARPNSADFVRVHWLDENWMAIRMTGDSMAFAKSEWQVFDRFTSNTTSYAIRPSDWVAFRKELLGLGFELITSREAASRILKRGPVTPVMVEPWGPGYRYNELVCRLIPKYSV